MSVIDDRIKRLKGVGFELVVSSNSIYYKNGKSIIYPTMIIGMQPKDFNKLINKHNN